MEWAPDNLFTAYDLQDAEYAAIGEGAEGGFIPRIGTVRKPWFFQWATYDAEFNDVIFVCLSPMRTMVLVYLPTVHDWVNLFG